MDNPDNPYSLSLIVLVTMMSFNLIIDNDAIESFKTHFIRRVKASVSTTMHELGAKTKKYHRMSDISFWKLHQKLKDEINSEHINVSRRSRKKRKKSILRLMD